MLNFNIKSARSELKKKIQEKIDNKTKPLGALGMLEKIALQVATIQGTLSPELLKPNLIVFASDHGLAKAGVSAFPQEVTYQMVLNFVMGGAAINVFCKQHGIDLSIVDAGVNFDFDEKTPILNYKIAKSTANILEQPAMTRKQCLQALVLGAQIVKEKFEEGCNVIAFGEMGIGNTASASLLMSQYCNLPIAECTGSGTGLDQSGVLRKIEILEKCIMKHGRKSDALETLATYGGFEIAMITGAILQAAELQITILIDGFIVTSALLAAHAINKNVLDYSIFTHQSEEAGHKKMIKFLDRDAVLQLGMRLGEGSGAAVCYPMIVSAVNFFNEMASFENANVSGKE